MAQRLCLLKEEGTDNGSEFLFGKHVPAHEGKASLGLTPGLAQVVWGVRVLG